MVKNFQNLPSHSQIEELVLFPFLKWKAGEWSESTWEQSRQKSLMYFKRIYKLFEPSDFLKKIITLSENEFRKVVYPYRDPYATQYQKDIANWFSAIWHWIRDVIPSEYPDLREEILLGIGVQARRLAVNLWPLSVEEELEEEEEEEELSPVFQVLTESVEQPLTPAAGDHPVRCVDMFCGAGGLTRGLHQAGGITIEAVDFYSWAVKTFNANWGPVALEKDVGLWLEEDAPKLVGNVDLLVGGPPCFSFSSGVRGGAIGPADTKNKIPQFIQALKIIQPRAFIMENVPGLRVTKKWSSVYQDYLAQMRQLGFEVEDQVIWAHHYGCPQARDRLFVVGTRDRNFEFPEGIVGAPLAPGFPAAPASDLKTLLPNRFPPSGAGTPIPPANPKKYDFEPAYSQAQIGNSIFTSSVTITSGPKVLNPDGAAPLIRRGAQTHWFDTKGKAYNYWLGLKTLHEAYKEERKGAAIVSPQYAPSLWRDHLVQEKGKQNRWHTQEYPSSYLIEFLVEPKSKWLLTTYKSPIANTQIEIFMDEGSIPGASCLSYPEAALIQGFPPDYKWRGPKTAIWSMIGNAVPSVFGYYLLKALIEQGFV